MIRLRLLGESTIEVDGTPVGPESQVLFAVLLVLALERGKRLARTALHRLLWPGADDESGRHNLRQVLYKLRQLGVPLEGTQGSVQLPAHLVEGELVALITNAEGLGERLLAGRRVGELLPGYAPTFSSPYADWLDEQRALLHAQLRRALLSVLATARTEGRWREVEALAREVLRVDALNEEATLALAEATALTGAKAQAIGIIDRYLHEVGGHPGELRVPATVLRRRIAERFPTHRYVHAADACFVGRAAEMAQLLSWWHRAKDRRGGGALVWGEPGIGKSRLTQELGKVAVLQGAQLQRVSSRSWDVQRPLGAIVDIVPPLRDLPGAAGVDPGCNEYLDRLTKHDPSRMVTDLPDPATLHRQVRQSVFDLVDALLAEAPLVLVFEDVQWMDGASWEVIGELLRLARTRRLLLVLTARLPEPPQMPASEDWDALRRLRLGGIDARATGELLDAVTREAGRYIDPEYREWCVPLANGNPLHVREIALHWLEKGGVREAPGALRTMLEARMDRLTPDALLLLQLSAILGSHAHASWMARMGLLAPKALLLASDELLHARLVASDATTTFHRHPVVDELVLERLTPAVRLLLHRTVAPALEEIALEHRDANLLWEAALHWQQADDNERAIALVCRCAEHLLLMGMPGSAAQLYELATPLVQTDADRSAIVSGHALALAQDDRWDRVIGLLRDFDTRDIHGPGAPTGPALLRLFEARWRQHGEMTPLIHDALAIARSYFFSGSVRLEAATQALIFADNCDGDLTKYHECAHEVELLLRSESIPAWERHRHEMIHAAASRRSDDSAAHARDMIQHLPKPATQSTIQLLCQAASGLRIGGLLDEAERALLEALSIARQSNSQSQQRQCFNWLSNLSLYQHRIEAAVRWRDLALALPISGRNVVAEYSLHFTAVQVCAVSGDGDGLHKASKVIAAASQDTDNDRRKLASSTAVLCMLLAASAVHPPQLEHRLSECLRLLYKTWNRGNVDFMVSTCARALERLGRKREARDLADRFVADHRLEAGMLHLDLNWFLMT